MLAETAVAVEGPLAKSNGVDVMDGEAGGKKETAETGPAYSTERRRYGVHAAHSGRSLSKQTGLLCLQPEE